MNGSNGLYAVYSRHFQIHQDHVRLQGAPEDVATVLENLQEMLTVQDVSADYPDRNNPNSVRRYLTVLFLATKGD